MQSELNFSIEAISILLTSLAPAPLSMDNIYHSQIFLSTKIKTTFSQLYWHVRILSTVTQKQHQVRCSCEHRDQTFFEHIPNPKK